MRRAPLLASIVVALAGAAGAAVALGPDFFTRKPAAALHDVLDQYCFRCHSSSAPAAGLNLRGLDFDRLEENGAIWEKVLRKMRSQEMPPAGRWKPDAQTHEALVKFIESGRDRLAETKPNPGRPTLHRLNRTEYTNAIRDLLAVEIDGETILPADDSGRGFDNIADMLTVSPLLMERYMSAAEKISSLALGDQIGRAHV